MAVRIGYAPGAYDLFHIGHLNILRQARSRCDYLVAGVVSDEMCEVTKGRRPVIPLAERMEIVGHISLVDEVYAERTPDKLDAWHDVHFTHIFKGDDWKNTPKGDKLERDFSAVGVEVIYFPYTVHTSSTVLRRALDAILEPAAPAHSHDVADRARVMSLDRQLGTPGKANDEGAA